MPPQSGNPDSGIVTDADFLRSKAPEIEHGLFLARFPNWRLSVAGAIGIAWMVGGMYNYIAPDSAALRWAA
jgi:hypothetical protein